MARSQISYGSQGDDVKYLQETLNNAGYKLDVDGIFGTKTQEAVRNYQKANGLAVDGIVGTKTWGSIEGGGKSSSSATSPTTPFTYNPYEKSQGVLDAEAALEAHKANKPGDFKYSGQTDWDAIIDRINNREDFSYDVNGDALYQQYKDKYIQQGKLAMQDTMGQAVTMTGGYGNSYASTAGNQAYQAHLQELNDVVPELYALAREGYDKDTQELYNQYGLHSDAYGREYGEHGDKVNQYYTDLDFLANEAHTKAETEYGQWADSVSTDFGIWADKQDREQWAKEYDLEDKKVDLQDRQVTLQEKAYEDEKKNNDLTGGNGGNGNGGNGGSGTGGTGGTGGNGNSGGNGNNGGYTMVNTQGVKNFKAGIRTKNEFYGRESPEKEKYKTYDAYIEGKLDQWLNEGRLTEEEVATLIAYYGLA